MKTIQFLKKLLSIALLFGFGILSAQQYDTLQVVEDIPLVDIQAIFVDLNHNGAQDLFYRGRNNNTGEIISEVLTRIESSDSTISDSFSILSTNIVAEHDGEFIFSDLNNDNALSD